MQKTRRKDTLRNIRKQLISWLSIIVISSFAVTAYLGLTFSARALSSAGKKLYDSTNYHDIQVTSNCLLSTDDLNSISNLEKISCVEGLYRAYGRISENGVTTDVQIYSLPKEIDLPKIKEGALPKADNECILEENLADKLGFKIGDVISPVDSYDEEIIELSVENFVLTGTFIHAEHSSFDLDETYCMMIPEAAFDTEQFDNCYPIANIAVEKGSYRSLFSKAYFDSIDPIVDDIENLSNERSDLRYEEHLDFLTEQIQDSNEELSDAKDQLSFAEKMIPSLQSKTGSVAADMSNMLSVLIDKDPTEYKTADEQTADYYDALKTYDNALKKVDEAKKNLDRLTDNGNCVWYVFNRNSSLDFMNLKNNAQNLEKLNMTFSLLFVIIAIMVIFASLSRMVLEQRSIIGISKALGMRFREIFSKYFIFGFSATILGICLGVLLSLYAIEGVISVGYQDHFVFGRFPFMLDVYPTIGVTIVALIISALSIYLSCSGLMKQSAKKLLSPLVPKGHSRSLKKNSVLSGLSLYNRMILLNIRSDIARVMVTIISIAGCCCLVVIGFTLKSSIIGSVDGQVEEFTHYDGIINLNTALYDEAADNVESVLSDYNIDNTLFLHRHGSIQIDDTMEYAEFLISDDLNRISSFHTLTDFFTRKELSSYPKEGIIITNRLSEMYNLKQGDTVYLIDDMGYKHPATVGAIVKNYIGRYIISTKSYYEKVLNDEFSLNAYFIRCENEGTTASLLNTLEDTEGFESYSPSSDLVNMFENLLLVLNLIILLLIFLAGVMALFVLLNLANMYLMSKRAELVILRVNGFTVSETVQYAIREVILTTTLGIALGVGFGILMSYSILRNMEQVHLMFVREPSISSCIYGAAVTAIFTAVIYAISMRKVKDMSLKDFLT